MKYIARTYSKLITRVKYRDSLIFGHQNNVSRPDVLALDVGLSAVSGNSHKQLAVHLIILFDGFEMIPEFLDHRKP